MIRGEVRVNPADGLEYRFVTDAWVRNIPYFTEPLASSSAFRAGTYVGEEKKDSNTGAKFRWNGSAWALVSAVVGVGPTVETGEITNGSVTTAKLAANAVTSAKIDPGLLQVSRVLVPSAQILTMHDSPIVLVPAPGTGKAVVVDKIVISLTYGTTPYTTNTAIDFKFGTVGGTTAAFTDGMVGMSIGILNSTASAMRVSAGVNCEKEAQVIATVAAGEAEAGDSDLTFITYYKVINA